MANYYSDERLINYAFDWFTLAYSYEWLIIDILENLAYSV